MNLKSGALLCAATVALSASGGFGAWHAEQKTPAKTDQKDQADVETSGKEISTGQEPGPLTFPDTWPAPLPAQSGDATQAATALAKKVLAGGPDALPALERAALQSGFSIHDQDGKVIFSPTAEADNGMSMLDMDLVVAAEGARRKTMMTYGDLQQNSGMTEEEFPLAYMFGHEIAEGIFCKNPALQFLSQFVMQLGAQSNDEADALGSSNETRLNVPQAIFQSYLAAGEAWAGAQPGTGNATPEEAPTVPPADEPPPAGQVIGHGPFLQAAARDAAFRNLQACQTSFSQAYILDFVQQHTGATPHSSLLALARMQLLRAGTTISLRMSGAPLVRSSLTGHTGGKRHLYVRVTFNISEDMRRRYNAARKFVPSAKALPDQGIQNVSVKLMTDFDVIVPKPIVVPTNGTEGDADLVGAVQTRTLTGTRLEDYYDTKLHAIVPPNDAIARKMFTVPIKDWLESGLTITIHIKVDGSGVISGDDSNLYWIIDRELVETSDLNYDMPMAAVSGTATLPNDKRFTSWMQRPDPMNPTKQDPPPSYHVSDLYVYEGPVADCAAKKGQRGQSVKRVESLPWKEPDEMTFNQSRVEWDAKLKKYSFAAAYQPVLVETSTDGASEGQTRMSILDGLEVPADFQHVVNESQMTVGLVDPTGNGVPETLEVKAFQGLNGPKTVRVSIDWIIKRPGASAGQQPPLTVAERQALQTKIQLMLAKALPKPEPSEGAFDLADLKPRLAPSAIAAHGPLWIADPSAAACSETQVSDQFPLSVKASH